MALSAVYVFQANTTLTAAQLNAMNNNILQNPIALVSPTTGAINFNLLNHVNLPITALSATSGSTGQVLTYVAGVPTWSSGAFPAVVNNPPCGYRVTGLSGSVSSAQTGSFAFDQAVVVTTDKTKSFQVTATSSFAVTLGTAGPAAGGRDQAGTFTSTFVHAYVITTGLNSTAPAGVLSSVPPPTGPTMPTSYSAWGYLGTFQYSSAANTFANAQYAQGQHIAYRNKQSVLTGGVATSETAISVSAVVPANALTFDTHWKAQNDNNVNTVNVGVRYALGATGATLNDVLFLDANGAGLGGFHLVGTARFANVGQALAYNWTSSGAAPSGTAPGLFLDVTAYQVGSGG